MAKNGTPLEWALEKVRVDANGCWPWTGRLDKDGYGKFHLSAETSHTGKKNSVRVHRFIYEGLRGPIPEDMVTDHLCRNRACCNPDHIEIVTVGENTKRGVALERRVAQQRAKTHCPYGHPYAGDNLIFIRDGTSRQCKICRNERVRAFYERKRVQLGDQSLF